ncbi:uncharacterized protein TNCV_70351 [Trichonephila clavipes]|nr:uncharacterized protein TNCV_70351 [Trichonephila clavipes]
MQMIRISAQTHITRACGATSKRLLRLGDYDDFKVAAVAERYRYRTVACLVTSSSPVPLKTRRVGQRCTLNMSRAKMSSRWEIGSRVGRNQTTVMRICDRWMQVGMTDRRGRSHPPQCTTSCQDRQIVRMSVMDRSVTSRTVTEHIESVTHHSVSARTIRRRLQQNGLFVTGSMLGLPLTQIPRRLRRQWCDERRMWVAEWNEVVITD